MSRKPKDQHDDEEPATAEPEPPDDLEFRTVWELLARAGQCDEAGGSEYRRVIRAWHKAKRPGPIVHYIKREANRRDATGE